ncbi:MAG: HDIG domain-containing protein [Bacteroidetes Order II. Incertae sedis bacterium]|nr:HDIG domain-containing protein [Bacteroidetes Order II. bacterium]
MPTYEDALTLFHTWTTGESLRKHAYAVEAAVGYYARLFGEDENLWRITALLHDMDYERHKSQEEHPFVGVKVLEELGYPNEVREAILGHATYSGVPRTSHLAQTLFACDELAGFITAIAYMRPDKLNGMEVKSVKKKLKDKAFAAAVSREDIRLGALELGIELEQHIANVITGMQAEAGRLGF